VPTFTKFNPQHNNNTTIPQRQYNSLDCCIVVVVLLRCDVVVMLLWCGLNWVKVGTCGLPKYFLTTVLLLGPLRLSRTDYTFNHVVNLYSVYLYFFNKN